MTDLRTLIAKAAQTYDFRARGPFEGERQYLDALITHVEQRDFAMAHELRTGRAQAAWTDEDVASFRQRLLTRHQPAREIPRPGVMDGLTIFDGGQFETTERTLLDVATSGLASVIDTRIAHPTRQLLILANVLLMNGRLLVTAVPRGDRIAILKTMARELPVFGYFLIADVFIHGVPGEGHSGPATKRDALIAHIGTRDLARMIVRPYQVLHGRAIFEDPPPADLDKRGPERLDDPYASIFVSVPSAPRVQ